MRGIIAFLAVLSACHSSIGYQAASASDDRQPAITPGGTAAEAVEHARIDPYAERWLDMLIGLEAHDDWDGVNYWGPSARREQVARENPSLQLLEERATRLQTELVELAPTVSAPVPRRRVQFLVAELDSFVAEVQQLRGAKFSVDEEARRLFGSTIEPIPEEELRALRAALDAIVPGEGPLTERYAAHLLRVTVPAERVDAALRASVDLCRERTHERIPLPEQWRVEIQLDDELRIPGEIQYGGGFSARLRFSTQPASAMRILTIACHEGFPGHFLKAALRERRAVTEGHPELLAPPYRTSQLEEGAAEFAYQAVFSPEQQVRAMKETVLPAGGLDPAVAELHVRVWVVGETLRHLAATEAGRRLLAGEMSRAQAEAWLEDIAVYPQAGRWLDYVEASGAYALLYGTGAQRIRREVEAAGGTVDDPDRRWAAYLAIIDDPWPL